MRPKRNQRQEQSTGSGCDIQATIDDLVLDHTITHTAAMPSITDVPMRERQQVPAKALNTPYPVRHTSQSLAEPTSLTSLAAH